MLLIKNHEDWCRYSRETEPPTPSLDYPFVIVGDALVSVAAIRKVLGDSWLSHPESVGPCIRGTWEGSGVWHTEIVECSLSSDIWHYKRPGKAKHYVWQGSWAPLYMPDTPEQRFTVGVTARPITVAEQVARMVETPNGRIELTGDYSNHWVVTDGKISWIVSDLSSYKGE